jgi:glutamine synthetase
VSVYSQEQARMSRLLTNSCHPPTQRHFPPFTGFIRNGSYISEPVVVLTTFTVIKKRTMRKKTPIAEILKQLAEKDVQKVKLAVTDIDGVLRGKMISFEKFKSIAEKSVGFCDVVFGWDVNDASYTNSAFTGWHTGYPDASAVVDFETFREVPWENDLPFFLADFRDKAGNDLPVCPRSLLKKIIAQAEEAGYLSYFSQEFEWYNFSGSGDE